MKKQSAQKECKLPPNYFIAVRIRNNEILTKLKSIQENIVKTKEDLKHALISADTFHLTLCVLRIDGEDELNKADQLMETFQQKLRERNDLRKLFLTVQGLDHFRNQVVFAKVKNDENFAQLEKLADTVVSCFEESKMVIKDHEKFTPHLTLAKLSKAPLLRTKRIKAISRDSYADFAEDTFGVEEVDSVQLLSMSKRKAEDGYYYCQKEISLTD
uniref:A-kinase anchor protein 7-like phosphoesterase domain-containing protein n=1 Tax=Strigamia maritima TaxID=126957 RepID=T1IM56_STRMM